MKLWKKRKLLHFSRLFVKPFSQNDLGQTKGNCWIHFFWCWRWWATCHTLAHTICYEKLLVFHPHHFIYLVTWECLCFPSEWSMITTNKVVKWKKGRKRISDVGSPESSMETGRQWFATLRSTHGIGFNTFPLFDSRVEFWSIPTLICMYRHNMDYQRERGVSYDNLHIQYNIIYNSHINYFVYSIFFMSL